MEGEHFNLTTVPVPPSPPAFRPSARASVGIFQTSTWPVTHSFQTSTLPALASASAVGTCLSSRYSIVYYNPLYMWYIKMWERMAEMWHPVVGWLDHSELNLTCHSEWVWAFRRGQKHTAQREGVCWVYNTRPNECIIAKWNAAQ